VALAATRFDIQAVIRVVDRYDALFGPTDADRSAQVAAAVRGSVDSYFTLRGASSLDPADYASYVASLPPEDSARLELAQARALLGELKALGLTETEYRLARNRMLATLRPDSAAWSVDDLAKAIEMMEQTPAM
jgi:hypothetical protein